MPVIGVLASLTAARCEKELATLLIDSDDVTDQPRSRRQTASEFSRCDIIQVKMAPAVALRPPNSLLACRENADIRIVIQERVETKIGRGRFADDRPHLPGAL